MKNVEVILRQHTGSVPKALAALVRMERELAAASTYADIRKVIREASALKALLGHVNEVKAQAEDTILVANRRIGEEIKKVPKAVPKGGPKKQFPPQGKSLAGRGGLNIPHTSRARLQKLADMPVATLKAVSSELRAAGKDATVAAVVREITQGDKKQHRAKRERELGAKQMAMPDRRYGVIYADPPWKFKSYNEDTGMDRAADNHYPTMETAAIEALTVPAADDCVLFLWATVPMLPEAFAVMANWGFDYKSHFVWVKDKTGKGYWNYNKHELLLIGTRGKIPAPAPGEQYPSVIEAARVAHSAKPHTFRVMIENMFPSLPRIELFARERNENWSWWGNEVSEAAE